MNADKAKAIIAQIVTETQRKYRKQYASAVWQDNKLKELGIFELMPKGFRHSDADAVLKAAEQAEGYTGGFDAYGEGYDVKIDAHPLYQALHEVETVEEPVADAPATDDAKTFESVQKASINKRIAEIVAMQPVIGRHEVNEQDVISWALDALLRQIALKHTVPVCDFCIFCKKDEQGAVPIIDTYTAEEKSLTPELRLARADWIRRATVTEAATEVEQHNRPILVEINYDLGDGYIHHFKAVDYIEIARSGELQIKGHFGKEEPRRFAYGTLVGAPQAANPIGG